eukprot:7761537-Ditylum_brightwellii.AAC.1
MDTMITEVIEYHNKNVINNKSAGMKDTSNTGVHDITKDNEMLEDESDADGQENSPIKHIRKVFKQADATLQGKVKEILQTAKGQGRRTKPNRKRTIKRIKWSNKFNSNEESTNEGAITANKNSLIP